MTDHPSALVSAAEVPLYELLRKIPRDAIYQWENPSKEPWDLAMCSSPVGMLAHKAADALAAAPAALQASGVGEDIRQAIKLAIVANVSIGEGLFYGIESATDRILAALRAPSREPEGGAVRQSIIDFDVEDYVDGYELRGDEGGYMPTDDERALLTDAIHGVLSELSLATREEAPAEAGEVECDGCDGDRCVHVGSLCNLRARSSAPEAREEALGNLLAVIHGDGGHRALEVGTKQAALEAEKIVAGLFAAPSADKLRIAVEAIWEIAGGRATDGHNEAGRLGRIKDRAAEILAALKAEAK